MIIKKSNLAFVFAIFCLWIFNFDYSLGETYLAVGGGIIKTTGNDNKYWNMGFNIHGDLLGRITNNVYLVGHIAYNNFTPNEGQYKKELSGIPDLYFEISGSTKILEGTPALRFVLYSNKKIQAFWQIGAGGYWVNSNAEIDAIYMGTFQSYYAEDSHSYMGMNMGAGVMMGHSGSAEYSIYAMFHVLTTREEVGARYLTVNLSFLFGD
jgi:hypothetical protein